MAGYVNLISTKDILLEIRGCQVRGSQDTHGGWLGGAEGTTGTRVRISKISLDPRQGLARICYAAPYGCPALPNGESGGREHVEQAKAVAVTLGAVGALVEMLKRVNRRYHDAVAGER